MAIRPLTETCFVGAGLKPDLTQAGWKEGTQSPLIPLILRGRQKKRQAQSLPFLLYDVRLFQQNGFGDGGMFTGAEMDKIDA